MFSAEVYLGASRVPSGVSGLHGLSNKNKNKNVVRCVVCESLYLCVLQYINKICLNEIYKYILCYLILLLKEVYNF